MRCFFARFQRFLIFPLVTFLVLWSILILFPKNYIANYAFTDNVNQFLNSSKNKSTVIIGDSRSMAGLSPRIIDSTCMYNLSLSGATPIEGYFTLKKLIKANKIPETIILSYSPFHLVIDDYYPKAIKEDFFTFDEIKEINTNIIEENDIFWDPEKLTVSPFKFVNVLKTYLSYMKCPLFYSAEIKKSHFNRYYKNSQQLKQMQLDYGSFLHGRRDSCNYLNQEAELNKFNPNSLIVKYFKKTLILSKKNNIKIIYITLPFNESSFQALSPTFIKDYDNFFASLNHEFPELICYSELKKLGNQFFGDRSHLNNKGRYEYSTFIKKYLIK